MKGPRPDPGRVADAYRGERMFKRIALFGPGLLGGSICKKLKMIDPAVEITAYARDAAKLAPALRDRHINAAKSYDSVTLAGIDLAVVATPVDISIDILRRILDHPELGDGAVVIDVGSVKEKILESVAECRRAPQFVGCHPMAGSEKMGFDASDADLYEGAVVFVTPYNNNDDSTVSSVMDFWERLGARTVIATPREHDIVIAQTSHLPHLVACSVMRVFSEFDQRRDYTRDIRPFIGKGFLDMTRISSGSPDMWRDITLLNRENILGALSRMIEELVHLKEVISFSDPRSRDIHDYFAAAKKVRDLIS